MSELTDKMRTCAAYIRARPNDAPMPTEHLLDDAARLLEEAARQLDDATGILGEPAPRQQGLLPKIPDRTLGGDNDELYRQPLQAAWVGAGELPPNPHPRSARRPPRVCPKCDSHATKKVLTIAGRVHLQCPACGTTWEYKP